MACCGGKSRNAPEKFLITYSDGTTEERSSEAAARIRAARDPKATVKKIGT